MENFEWSKIRSVNIEFWDYANRIIFKSRKNKKSIKGVKNSTFDRVQKVEFCLHCFLVEIRIRFLL